jgi:hypothetical protein
MDFVIQFFLSFFSFFIISHFIYRITGKKNWSYIFLGVIFVSSFYDFLQYVFSSYETSILILVFMSRVLPVIFAFSLFTKFTGGIPMRKIRVKKPKYKDPNEDIFTTSYLKKIIYIMFVLSVFIGILSYFFIDDVLKYVLLMISGFVVVFGIYKLIQLRSFKYDKIILIIGRQKELIYETTLDQKLNKLNIKDVYDNENYIIDKFATIHIYEKQTLIEKHYLYWIATSSVFEVEDKKFRKLQLPYMEHISSLMKYHDAIIKLDKSKKGYHLLKEKKYRK